MKVDFYTKIHKAQRQHLFSLSVKIGKIDFSDTTQSNHLKEKIKEMIVHLRKHSQNEERFIHPFFTQLGKQGEKFDHEHEMLENSLELLEETLNSNDGVKIYSDYNRFVAFYLQHTDAEETAQSQILWKHFSNEALMDVMQKFQQSLAPQEAMDGLKFMLPCLNIHEVTGILMGMKNSAPEAAFQVAVGITKNAFDPAQWQKIQEIVLSEKMI